MPAEQFLDKIAKRAAADLSAKQYRFVKLNSSEKAALAGDGGKATGILQNTPEADDIAEIGVQGRSLLVLGDTVSAGDDVASDSDGRGVPVASGDEILAEALEGGVIGDQVSVIIRPKGTV